MKKQKPVNFQLQTIRFPVTAIASILHRISGFIIFLVIGVLLWALELSLSSPEGFLRIVTMADTFTFKLFLWSILTVLTYHICSGIRHMLMDFGYLEERLSTGKITANIVFFLTVILSTLVGVYLW